MDDIVVLCLLAAGAFSLLACYWRFILQRLRGIHGGNWPTLPATIDIVSVVEERGGRGDGVLGYLATLTYFYNSRGLQTGDYCRMFNPDEEEDARAWADSYKGTTVTVHVDPKDPTQSILRQEEL